MKSAKLQLSPQRAVLASDADRILTKKKFCNWNNNHEWAHDVSNRGYTPLESFNLAEYEKLLRNAPFV